MICFLDMDGVLADFVDGISRAHNRPNPFNDPKVRGGSVWEITEVWGISEEEFWKPSNNAEFWAGLKETPEASQLVQLATELFGDNIAMLTAPSESEWCLPGKKTWMMNHFPKLYNRMIFTNAGSKKFLAGEGRILVDDRDQNIQQWIKAGGTGVICPRPWNDSYSKPTWETVRDGLRQVSSTSQGARPWAGF